jgi:hypothetical protein
MICQQHHSLCCHIEWNCDTAVHQMMGESDRRIASFHFYDDCWLWGMYKRLLIALAVIAYLFCNFPWNRGVVIWEIRDDGKMKLEFNRPETASEMRTGGIGICLNIAVLIHFSIVHHHSLSWGQTSGLAISQHLGCLTATYKHVPLERQIFWVFRTVFFHQWSKHTFISSVQFDWGRLPCWRWTRYLHQAYFVVEITGWIHWTANSVRHQMFIWKSFILVCILLKCRLPALPDNRAHSYPKPYEQDRNTGSTTSSIVINTSPIGIDPWKREMA